MWDGRKGSRTKTDFVNEGGFIRALAKINYSRWQTKNDELSSPSVFVLQNLKHILQPWLVLVKSHLMHILILYCQVGYKLLGDQTYYRNLPRVLPCSVQSWVSFDESECPELPIHRLHPQPFSVRQVKWGAGMMLRTLSQLLRLASYESYM